MSSSSSGSGSTVSQSVCMSSVSCLEVEVSLHFIVSGIDYYPVLHTYVAEHSTVILIPPADITRERFFCVVKFGR